MSATTFLWRRNYAGDTCKNEEFPAATFGKAFCIFGYLGVAKNTWISKLVTIVITVMLTLAFAQITCKHGWLFFNGILAKYNNLLELLDFIVSTSAVASIFVLLKQIKSEHEKSRREKCLDLLMTWTTHLTPETNFAVKIVEQFDKDQCIKLYRMEQFSVSKELCHEIKSVYSEYGTEGQMPICRYLKETDSPCDGKIENVECGNCELDSESNMVLLDKYYIKKLRFSIIQYLNLLETVLVGWQNSIVDKDIVEQQFSYLHDPANNKNCLQHFRIASGSETSYPCIEAFCITLEENRKGKIKGKGNIA